MLVQIVEISDSHPLRAECQTALGRFSATSRGDTPPVIGQTYDVEVDLAPASPGSALPNVSATSVFAQSSPLIGRVEQVDNGCILVRLTAGGIVQLEETDLNEEPAVGSLLDLRAATLEVWPTGV